MEREKDEREWRQAEEERRKRREELQRIKRMLEASFEGEDDEIRAVLKEVHVQNHKLRYLLIRAVEAHLFSANWLYK